MGKWDVSEESSAKEITIEKVDNNFVKHMISSYGGITSIVSNITTGLRSFEVLKKNKWIMGITKTVTVGMVAYDVYNKVKVYKKAKNSDINSAKTSIVRQMLGMGKNEYYNSHGGYDTLNSTVLHWFMKSSDHDNLKIKGFYNLKDGQMNTSFQGMKEFGILVQYNNAKAVIEVEMVEYGSISTPFLGSIHTDAYNGGKLFAELINVAYIDHIGWDDNVLIFDNYTIRKRERSSSVGFSIRNIDFDKFKTSICKVLEGGHKRGYLLVGNPGTGKSSILLKLEQELREYPIIYVGAGNLNDESNIGKLSIFIQNMGKCIVFIEDMDTLEIEDKSKKFGPLLSLFDNSRAESAVVFIATINNAELVNESLVRTGRFDEIVEVKEPESNEDIFHIMKTRLDKVSDDKVSYTEKHLSFLTYLRLKLNGFTQSDYCEIVQSIVLEGDKFSNSAVIKSMRKLNNSKSTFKRYQKDGKS